MYKMKERHGFLFFLGVTLGSIIIGVIIGLVITAVL